MPINLPQNCLNVYIRNENTRNKYERSNSERILCLKQPITAKQWCGKFVYAAWKAEYFTHNPINTIKCTPLKWSHSVLDWNRLTRTRIWIANATTQTQMFSGNWRSSLSNKNGIDWHFSSGPPEWVTETEWTKIDVKRIHVCMCVYCRCWITGILSRCWSSLYANIYFNIVSQCSVRWVFFFSSLLPRQTEKPIQINIWMVFNKVSI